MESADEQKGRYIIDVSTLKGLKGDPIRVQFDARKNMIFKVLSNGKAIATCFENVKLADDMLEDIRKNMILRPCQTAR